MKQNYNELTKNYKKYNNFEAIEKFIKHLLITVENFKENVIQVKNIDNKIEYSFFFAYTNNKWRLSINCEAKASKILEFYEINNLIEYIINDCDGRYRLSIRII